MSKSFPARPAAVRVPSISLTVEPSLLELLSLRTRLVVDRVWPQPRRAGASR